MQMIQINNSEIESFLSLNDGYPAITKKEATLRVAKAIEEVKNGSAKLLSQEEYNEEMNEFMKSL